MAKLFSAWSVLTVAPRACGNPTKQDASEAHSATRRLLAGVERQSVSSQQPVYSGHQTRRIVSSSNRKRGALTTPTKRWLQNVLSKHSSEIHDMLAEYGVPELPLAPQQPGSRGQ